MTKLYRSRTDSKIFGLCGGIAEILDIDSSLLRVILIITAVFSGGTVIPIYIIASLVIPKEPPYGKDFRYRTTRRERRFEREMNRASARGMRMDADEHTESTSHVDDMMKDIERKAMQKEIDELREKLREFENDRKGE